MKLSITTRFLPFWAFSLGLTLLFQTAFGASVEEQNRRLEAEINFLERAIEKEMKDISAESINLLEALREQNLNHIRRDALEEARINAVEKYLSAIEYARLLKDYDRKNVFLADGYYEITAHPLPKDSSTKPLEQTFKNAYASWTLIFGGDGPLKQNCLLDSITIQTTKDFILNESQVRSKTVQQAYAVILTPVVKNKETQPALKDDIETSNAVKIIGQDDYCFPDPKHLFVRAFTES